MLYNPVLSLRISIISVILNKTPLIFFNAIFLFEDIDNGEIKYIDATNSDYGLFIIFNTQENKVVFERQIKDLVKLYENEEKIFVLGINCL